jgi:hypothetical protein
MTNFELAIKNKLSDISDREKIYEKLKLLGVKKNDYEVLVDMPNKTAILGNYP